MKNYVMLNQEFEKIYKNGYDSVGSKKSIHYFQSQPDKDFNVKVKSG